MWLSVKQVFKKQMKQKKNIFIILQKITGTVFT